MSIPLVQNNEKDSINTSIIAIKRQIERINALLGLSNSEEIDTSVFATKTELEDAVTQAVTQVETDLAPVDEVTADNMQSVTSNAVAEKISTLGNDFTFTPVRGLSYTSLQTFKFGNMCALTGGINGSNISSGALLLTLPSGYRPSKSIYVNGVCENSSTKYPIVIQIQAGGGVYFWHNASNVSGVFLSAVFKC